MDRYRELTLIETETITTEDGTPVERDTVQTVVPCQLKNVSIKENYEALSVGHRPELKVEIRDERDYNGQRAVIIDEERYNVLRVATVGMSVQLTLERV